MKVTMKFLRLAAAALAVAAFVSCEENTPETPDSPEDPSTPVTPPEETIYPEKEMTFVVDGVESPVGSAFADPFEEYVLFSVSPISGLESYTDIFDGEYLQVMLLPEFLNQDIDLKAESHASIYVYDDETEISSIDSEMLESGTMRLEYDEETGKCVLLMAMVFTNGTEVGINASAVKSEAAPEKCSITVNDDTEPVRAAFYMDYPAEDGNYVYLYFTSSEVYYLEEMLDIATSYFYLALNEDDLTGNEFDITDTDKYFYIGYIDQVTGDDFTAIQGELNGAKGTVNVSRDGSDPASFTAEISVTFGNGTAISVSYDGTAVSADYVPEEPNEFTYNGATQAIQSVLVDKSDADIWHIYVSEVGDLEYVSEFEDMGAIHITAPAEVFNAGPVGFSTYKEDLKFEYEGKTWQYKEDGSVVGTLDVSLVEDQIVLDFTTYSDLSGHYSGTAVIVE